MMTGAAVSPLTPCTSPNTHTHTQTHAHSHTLHAASSPRQHFAPAPLRLPLSLSRNEATRSFSTRQLLHEGRKNIKKREKENNEEKKQTQETKSQHRTIAENYNSKSQAIAVWVIIHADGDQWLRETNSKQTNQTTQCVLVQLRGTPDNVKKTPQSLSMRRWGERGV